MRSAVLAVFAVLAPCDDRRNGWSCPSDRGHRLRVLITATSELGTVRATSAPTRRIG
jgi:hypothetical protein